ncbi:MAG: hypothetical protein QOG20_5661 [Pseudonocardiales bacterium]|nr:hypothetical protein [Pseudonocardiales bacterium]
MSRISILGVVPAVLIGGVGALTLSTVGAVVTLTVAGAVGLSVAIRTPPGVGSRRPAWPSVRAGLLAGAATVVAGLLVQGLVWVTGPVAPQILLLIVAGAAVMVWWHRHPHLRPPRDGRAPAIAPGGAGTSDPDPVELQVTLRPVADGLSIPELCQQWRRSYLALGRARDLAGRAQVVSFRAGYLDELERRDPVGFRRWLRDGARAASDPSRFVTAHRRSTDRPPDDAGEPA